MTTLIDSLDLNVNLNQKYNKNNLNSIINHSNNEFKLFFKDTSVLKTKNIKVEKQKIKIETKINSIDDLILIIKTYPYNENLDYNINLKNLHSIKEPLIKLNKMVGLENIKQNLIYQILFYLQNLHINNMTNENDDYLHTVLYGKPGTGKTEIAMIIGEIFSNLGILKKNKFKKVTRKDLVGGYLGHTAILTGDIIKECLGGVLFIDEAYALGNSEKKDSYSKECIDTLCEALSAHKNELMVIIAGYKNDIKECFFNYNPGLESRFSWKYEIDSYTSSEMTKIAYLKIDNIAWKIENNILDNFFIKNESSFKHFGRDIEILLSKIKIVHSKRIFGLECEKTLITLEDLTNGFELYLENTENNNNNDDYILNTIYT